MHNWFRFIPFFFVTRELLDLIKRCAQYGESNSVLLIGPRGSGKSLVRTLSKFCNAVKLLLIVCLIRAIPALLTEIAVFLVIVVYTDSVRQQLLNFNSLDSLLYLLDCRLKKLRISIALSSACQDHSGGFI